MSDWIERINRDLVEALKGGDHLKTSVLRMVKSDLNKVKIEKGDLSEQDALSVLKRAVKQREDSIDAYRKAGREDIAASEALEMKLIQSYLPAEMDDAQLVDLVSQAVRESGAASKADFGKAMKAAMAKVAGQADGKRVKAAVEKALAAL